MSHGGSASPNQNVRIYIGLDSKQFVKQIKFSIIVLMDGISMNKQQVKWYARRHICSWSIILINVKD